MAFVRLASAFSVSLLCGLGCRDAARTAATAGPDSLGVRIIEAGVTSAPPTPLDLVPMAFSAELPEFGNILDVAPAPGRRLVVLDPLGPHVVVLDSTGAEQARFGGEGDGPGEFRAPGLTGVVVLGDTVAVPDILRQRVTLFDLDGRVLDIVTVDVTGGPAVDWRRSSGGGLIFRRVSDPQRLEALSLQASVQASAVDVLRDFAALGLPSEAGPLTPQPIWCPLSDGRIAFARTDRYSISVVDGDATDALLDGGEPPRPLRDADFQHLHDLLRESIGRRGGGEVDPALVSRLLEQVPLPEEAPLIAGLRCSSRAEVWVQRALPVGEMGVEIFRVGSTEGWGSHAWDVFDLDSGDVRRTDLPPGTRLTRVTDQMVVGFTVDEYGREEPARWLRR